MLAKTSVMRSVALAEVLSCWLWFLLLLKGCGIILEGGGDNGSTCTMSSHVCTIDLMSDVLPTACPSQHTQIR